MEEDTEVGVDGLLDGEPGRSVALPLREEARPDEGEFAEATYACAACVS